MPEAPVSSIEIRTAFRQPLPPIRITRGYTARLAGVLCGLVLLQAFYLLLIAVVGAFTVFYTMAVFGSGITPNLFTIAFYVGPPIAGVIVTVFLLKPLIIRPPRPPQPLQLTPDQEPILFEFVEQLCRALRSPRPSRIFADLRVNASASVPGWRGFFLGHLDLTIGLPLAAGLSLPQFTGVLAHEFGHFSQRTGLRSYFLIQAIQHWFARVVHQRDKMDAWLDRQRERRDWRIKVVAHLASLAVTLSRTYLTLLMKAAAWISAAFSRQMEFDADRWETAIVGFEIFEQTSRQLPLHAVGMHLAWQDVNGDWSVGTLPEDVARLAAARKNFLSPEISDQIMSAEMGKVTGRWDTHPCLAERIASARATGFQRALHLDGPAERLFRDLGRLCSRATMHHYQKGLGLKTDLVRMIPAEEAIAKARVEREYANSVQTMFGTTSLFCARWFRLPPGEPRRLEPLEPSDDPEPKFDAAAYDAALHTNLLHFAALVMRQSGVAVNPVSFRVPAADFETIRQQESITTSNMHLALEENRRAAARIATHIEGTVARILNQELAIVISSDHSSNIPDLSPAWKCYGALSQRQDEIMDVRRHEFALQIVRANANVFPAATCANLIEDLEARALAEIGNIIAKAGDVPTTMQFDPRHPATVSGQLECGEGSRTERIQTFLSRADVLLARTLGQLAWLTLAACPIPEQES